MGNGECLRAHVTNCLRTGVWGRKGGEEPGCGQMCTWRVGGGGDEGLPRVFKGNGIVGRKFEERDQEVDWGRKLIQETELLGSVESLLEGLRLI